jgi:predicted nucleotide-binding protein (sugar kinase/HSP70/actin superfamily)
MIRKLKDEYPYSNIVAIDYDPGATKINQENRVKLMLANAKGLTHQEPARLRPEPQLEREPQLAHANI